MSSTNTAHGGSDDETTDTVSPDDIEPDIEEEDPIHQTEFDFSAGSGDGGDVLETKDDPVNKEETIETDLGDFFEEAEQDETRAEQETRLDSRGSSLLADRRIIPSEQKGGRTPPLVIRDVPEDQRTLEGGEAHGQHSRVVREAAEGSDD
jgi:hypothetical protein